MGIAMDIALALAVCFGVGLLLYDCLKRANAPRPAQRRAPRVRHDGPTCDTLRHRFRVGMSRDEFFATCDDLLPLRLTSPTLDPNVVGIYVAEGGVVLFFLSEDRGLLGAELDGAPFLLA
jgi:hypothetical protein